MDKNLLFSLLIILLLLAYNIYVIIYEKRSIKSKLFENIIKYSGYKNYISKDKVIEKEIIRRIKNGNHYKLPKFIYKTDVTKRHFKNMDYYVFNKQGTKTIFYLHGGSYFDNPLFLHIEFLDNLAKQSNCKIILPIYPKIPFNTYIESEGIVLELFIKLFNKPQDVVLMGDSSGGSFCLALSYLLKRNNYQIPDKLILLSPWVDATMSNKQISKLDKLDPQLSVRMLSEMGKLWAGTSSPANPLVSPIYGDLSILKSVTIFAGTHELLLPDIRNFKDKCLKNNVKVNYYEYKNMNHVFVLQPIKEAKNAIKEIIDIIEND